jgi:hypothetical protein
MNTPDIIDPAKCPLCGENNDCQNICGDPEPNKNCWCKEVKFPKQLLDAVPVETKNKVCICQRCLNKTLNP